MFKNWMTKNGYVKHLDCFIERVVKRCDDHEKRFSDISSIMLSFVGIAIGGMISVIFCFIKISPLKLSEVSKDEIGVILVLIIMYASFALAIVVIILNIIMTIQDSNKDYRILCHIRNYLLKLECEILFKDDDLSDISIYETDKKYSPCWFV